MDETLTADLSVSTPSPLATFGERQRKQTSVWRRFIRNPLAITALLVLALLAGISFSAPLWLPPDRVVEQIRSATFAPPSLQHWFGLDEYGRDVFARAVYGGRLSLWIAFSSALLSTVIGTVLGMMAGYFGGWIDVIIDRMIEMILTIPFLLLLILAASVARPSATSILLILGLFDWPVLARIVRGEFLSLRRRDFIEAARSTGCSNTRIVVRHILPNSMAPIIVTGTLIVAIHLTTEAAISFLGLGIQPPTPSWVIS